MTAKGRSASISACILAASSGGCAQISAETRSTVVVAPDARPSHTSTSPVQSQLEVRWSQRGATLELELLEHRSCRTTSLVPGRREDRVIRRPDALIYWEYGAAALALGLAAAAFARPEAFSTQRYDSELNVYVRDAKTGYRLGGVFTAIGTGFLIAGVVDTLRARDQVRSHATTVSREGPLQPCPSPTLAAGRRAVELSAGSALLRGVTDLEGRVSLTLPADLAAPEPAGALTAALHVGPDVLALPLLAPASASSPREGSLRGPAR